jgi:hypothetical protein
MKLELIKTKFDSLSNSQQWEWIIEYRQLIEEIILDNDNTSIHLHGDKEAKHVLYPKMDCGDRYGVLYLLRGLGFNANHC